MTIRQLGTRAFAELAYYGSLTLVVALIAHLDTILTLPRGAEHDAYATVAQLAQGKPLQTVRAPAGQDLFAFGDPALASAFCLYDLTEAPVRVSVDVVGADFVAVSVHARHGRVFYALTNRSASRGSLSLTLMTTAQIALADAQDTGEDPVRELRVEASESKGFVAVQALAIAPSMRTTAEATAGRLTCEAAKPR